MYGIKTAVNACAWMIRRRAKRKALHPQQMQGKRKAPPGWGRVENFISAIQSSVLCVSVLLTYNPR